MRMKLFNLDQHPRRRQLQLNQLRRNLLLLRSLLLILPPVSTIFRLSNSVTVPSCFRPISHLSLDEEKMFSLPSLIHTLGIQSKGKRQDNKHNRSSSEPSQVLTPPPSPPPLYSSPSSLCSDPTQAPQSTSTTPLPSFSSPPPPIATASKKKSAAQQPKKKLPPLTFDEVWKSWFERFEDPDDKGCITGEGVERFFEDMGVEMDGVSLYFP